MSKEKHCQYGYHELVINAIRNYEDGEGYTRQEEVKYCLLCKEIVG